MWKAVRLPSGAYTLERDDGKRFGLYWCRKDAERAKVGRAAKRTATKRHKRRSS